MRYGIGEVRKTITDEGVRHFRLEDEEHNIIVRYYDFIPTGLSSNIMGEKEMLTENSNKTTSKKVTIELKISEALSDDDLTAKILQIHEELKFL